METSTSFAEMEVSPLLEECVTSFDENEKEYSTAPLTEAATPVVVKCKEVNISLIGREITAFVKGAVEYSFSFSSNEVTLSSKSGETSISAKDVEVSMLGVEIVIGKGEKVENDHISEEGKGMMTLFPLPGEGLFPLPGEGLFPLPGEGRVGTRPSGPISSFMSLV